MNMESNSETTSEKSIFNVKYTPSLNKEEYKKIIDKNDNNKTMKDFLTSQWNL